MAAHLQSRIMLGGIVVLLAAGAGYTFFGSTPDVEHSVACTAEAKRCPDGSYVGRIEPDCEFAACPVVPSGSGTTEDPYTSNVSAKFNQTVTVGDVSITPVSLTEDSRCATDVQCIQAGTVRIMASVKNGDGVSVLKLTLGASAASGSDTITLIGVYPAPTSGSTIKPTDYLFTFRVVSQ